MMKNLLKMICLALVISLSVSILLPVYAAADRVRTANPKILIVVEDFDAVCSSIPDCGTDYDIMSIDNLDYSTISDYSGYAVPYETAIADAKLCKVLKNAYAKYDSRIYMYGTLTIAGFKDLLDIENFGAEVDIFDANGPTGETAFLSFGEDQVNNCTENIFSYSKSTTQENLIATVYQGENVVLEYVRIILEDYNISEHTPMASVVKSGFNYRSYLTGSIYANMDFLLYRDFNEYDPNYDYFAIKTNICTVGQSTIKIEAEHRMAYSADEMIDYGPGDISRAGSVSVGLDLGSGYGGGSLSYTFDVGGGPSIDASFYAASDYCTWNITRYWLFGDLVNELFCLGSSWASTGTYAATNVKFRALFDVYVDSLYSPWCTVQVRYDY